jgi:hypothetical protein
MFMAPIAPSHRRADYLVVRLLRRWAAGREAGEPQLPSLVRFAQRLGVEAQAAIAIASLFQLTEACLGRPLEAECSCSLALSCDERAVLLMLGTAAPASLHQAFPPIPHGLPGALLWSIASVRRLMQEELPSLAAPRTCPFARNDKAT